MKRDPRIKRAKRGPGIVPRAHGGNTTGPDGIAQRERDLTALALRREGRTFDDIAGALGFAGKQGAHAAVIRLLDNVLIENVDQYRTLENGRLDAMQAAVWSAALAADYAAIDRVLKIMERRARLNSLDMPARAPVDEQGKAVRYSIDDLRAIILDAEY